MAKKRISKKTGSGKRKVMQEKAITLDEALRVAIGLHQSKKLDDAEGIYRMILAQIPDHPDALHFLGLLMYHRGDRDQAIELMNKSILIAPEYADAYNNLGNLYNVNGEFDKAAYHYRKALEINPSNVSAHNNLGIVLKHLTDFEEAAEAFLKAIELMPDNADFYQNLGGVYRRHGKFHESAEAYRKSISLRGYNAQDYDRLCRTYYLQGDHDEMISVLREWLKLDPTNPLALHRMSAMTGENVPVRASDDYVSQTFDGFAESFDKVLSGLEYKAPLWILSAVERLIGKPDGQLSILDAGCGTGLCGPLVAPYARELVGVDLSAKMLELAKDRGCYTRLIQAELTAYVAAQTVNFDLIISADTLVYFGDLNPICKAVARVLSKDRYFVFTLESANIEPEIGYKINPHGRFAHAEGYIRKTLAGAGLGMAICERVMLRYEGGEPVDGFLIAASLDDEQEH